MYWQAGVGRKSLSSYIFGRLAKDALSQIVMDHASLKFYKESVFSDLEACMEEMD